MAPVALSRRATKSEKRMGRLLTMATKATSAGQEQEGIASGFRAAHGQQALLQQKSGIGRHQGTHVCETEGTGDRVPVVGAVGVVVLMLRAPAVLVVSVSSQPKVRRP